MQTRNLEASETEVHSPEKPHCDATQSDRIAIKVDRRVTFLQVSQIEWIQGADNYAELHAGKAVHMLRRTLGSLESEYGAAGFVRISRSILVNTHHVRKLQSKSHGDFFVVMKDGTRLTGSRNNRHILKHPQPDLGSATVQGVVGEETSTRYSGRSLAHAT